LEEYHNLNSERIFHLADGYVGLGDNRAADRYIDMGERLIGGVDARVTNLRCKSLVIQGRIPEALNKLDHTCISKEMSSFLNQHAVRHVKSRAFNNAVMLYKSAIQIAPKQKLLHAKLYYNLGLAELGLGNKLAAIDMLCRAETLG